MNYLALIQKSEQHKRKLYQAQMILAKKSACPLK